jgi:pimeloyl-ACP methyl ester carboxylesterase
MLPPEAGRPPAVLRLPALTNPSHVPLIAVPGLGLSVEVPAPTLRLLQPVTEFAVVALPGFGMPPDPATAVNPAALAARLLRHREARRAPHAVLLGHSASCQIVAEAAVQDPTRIVGLILVGPTTDPRAASWPGLAARWLRTAVWERPGQIPVLVRDYRHTGLAAMGPVVNAARRYRLDRALAAVSCPVLIVRGGTIGSRSRRLGVGPRRHRPARTRGHLARRGAHGSDHSSGRARRSDRDRAARDVISC